MTAIALHCDHDSLTGAEGPWIDLGRCPVIWTCDVCYTLVASPLP